MILIYIGPKDICPPTKQELQHDLITARYKRVP